MDIELDNEYKGTQKMCKKSTLGEKKMWDEEEIEEEEKTPEPPRFTHDCDCCKFIAQVDKYDLWLCDSEKKNATYIARRSDEGSDYSSGCDFGDERRKRVQMELGGMDEKQIIVMTTFRLLPSLLLNMVR